jgi:multidrug efflux pump subunit AcrA (membrane-fusion protein)
VLVVEAGRTVRRAVAFVDWPAQAVIVTAGLKPGEQIVSDPSKIAPGRLVRPSKEH